MVCKACGIDDPVEWMMREDSRRKLDFWIALDRVVPFDDSWMQTATICVQLEQLLAMQISSAGGKPEIKGMADFMPPQWVPPKPANREFVASEK